MSSLLMRPGAGRGHQPLPFVVGLLLLFLQLFTVFLQSPPHQWVAQPVSFDKAVKLALEGIELV